MWRSAEWQRASRTHWLLFVEALLAVVAFRVGLWLVPFRFVWQVPTRLMRSPGPPASQRACEHRVAWAVCAASRLVPLASCLTQALAVQTLLARRGYAAELQIGVAWNASGAFQAHAWLECHGRIIIGDLSHLQRYTRLPLSERAHL